MIPSFSLIHVPAVTMLFRSGAIEIGKFHVDVWHSNCFLVYMNVTGAREGVGAVANSNLNH
jgi:hypothetical protein